MIEKHVYDFFAKFVFEKTGIFYPEKDYYRLDSRINKLITQYECKDANDVYTKFTTSRDADMEKFLINICTNNETYFFRDDKPFKALVDDMIPSLQAEFPGKSLNLWSCASSTGQEAVSVIISILEKFGNSVPFSFDASDISTDALTKAKGGIYTNLDVQRGLPITLLVKYFESVNNGDWKAKPEVSSKVRFFEFNLFDKLFPTNKYHIIFCRNVLIYQNSENKAQILEKLAQALVPGGFLVLGAGESLIGTGVNLNQVTLSGSMVFQRPGLKSNVA